jgi:hypothetical protein
MLQRQHAHRPVTTRNSSVATMRRTDLNLACTLASHLQNQGEQTVLEALVQPWTHLAIQID